MTNKWFTENDNNEIEYRYAIKKQLCQMKSKFQKIEVFDTTAYGKMLILDDCVMITESDEFVYHELIAHIPSLYHPNPKKTF